MDHSIQVIIEHDKDGYYAFAPGLKGCHSQGDTMDEPCKARKNSRILSCPLDLRTKAVCFSSCDLFPLKMLR